MPAVEKTTSDVDIQVNVRTEEEQQAAVREREKQDILDRRDARRKSLGVFFSPSHLVNYRPWVVLRLLYIGR